MSGARSTDPNANANDRTTPPTCPRGGECRRIASTRLTCEVVDALLPTFATDGADGPDSTTGAIPSLSRVVEALHCLQDALLPGRMSTELKADTILESFVMERLAQAHGLLRHEIALALPYRWKGHFVVSTGQAPPEFDPQAEAERVLEGLFRALPKVRAMLIKDIEAAYLGDPAAVNFAEVTLAYPGIKCITTHRIAHELYKLDVPLIPRMMSEHAHSHTGIDIHPGARIGESFFIDHGTGVVIGETCEIGDRVKIYQGVTLGAKSFPVDENGIPIKNIKRHPTIEDDVIIYAGATILGGKTVIGKGSVIGGNVWLAHSVEPGSTVLQKNVEIDIRNGENS